MTGWKGPLVVICAVVASAALIVVGVLIRQPDLLVSNTMAPSASSTPAASSTPSNPASPSSPTSESPTPTPPPSTVDPDQPPYPGKSFAAWERFWKKHDWSCSSRPGYEDAKVRVCTRSVGDGRAMIEVQADGKGRPALFTVVLSVPKKQMDKRWTSLIRSLRPIVDTPTVEMIISQGDGGGFDYWDAVDVRTQGGYRVAFASSVFLRSGTTVPELDLTTAIKSIKKAGGSCNRYACIGPESDYEVSFGVAPTTPRMLITTKHGQPVPHLLDHLGKVGKGVQRLRDEPYAVGNAGGYLVSVAQVGDKEVIFVAEDPGLFRGSLPSGKRPKPPSMPPR